MGWIKRVTPQDKPYTIDTATEVFLHQWSQGATPWQQRTQEQPNDNANAMASISRCRS